MKSIALSLLVAVGVTLGSQAAFAEPTRAGTVTVAASAQASLAQAAVHAQRANEHRTAARELTAKSTQALKIADDDMKQGFTYQAGVMRERARQYQIGAQRNMEAATREDALAAACRVAAARQSNPAASIPAR